MNQDQVVIERPLPERPEIERMVLGAALTDPDAFSQIADVLQAEDFCLAKHVRIFRCTSAIHARGESISYVSVINELLKLKQFEADGRSYLSSLSDGIPRIVNLATFCEPIRTAAIRRRAIESATALIDRCFDPGQETEELLMCAERVTESLNAKGSRKLAARPLERYIDEAGGINPFLSPELTPGIHIPFPEIQTTLSGLRKSKFVIVGARPAVGKTAFAMQVAEHAAANGNRVLVVTLETIGKDLFHRSITGRAKVSAYKFREGLLDEQERRDIYSETIKLLDLGDKLQLAENTTVHGIASLLRSSVARGEPIDLVIVDYLQLLVGSGNFENRVQEVSKISRELKKFTIEFQIPIVALCQLKRMEDHRKNDRPELDWLKESGQLEQDADQVLFLWVKKDPEERETLREVHWRVAKNRDGMQNHGTLSFRCKYCRFDENVDEQEAVA
jgi:replicative DNA helicase